MPYEFDMSSEPYDPYANHVERVEQSLKSLHRKVDKMALDISHLTASEKKLVGVVSDLLAAVGGLQSALKTVSENLAAAVAAGDAVSNVALQQQIDSVSSALDSEIMLIGSKLQELAQKEVAPPVASTPQSPTGLTGPNGPVGAGDPRVIPTSPDTAPEPSTAGPTGSQAPGVTGSSGEPATGSTGLTGPSQETAVDAPASTPPVVPSAAV